MRAEPLLGKDSWTVQVSRVSSYVVRGTWTTSPFHTRSRNGQRRYLSGLYLIKRDTINVRTMFRRRKFHRRLQRTIITPIKTPFFSEIFPKKKKVLQSDRCRVMNPFQEKEDGEGAIIFGQTRVQVHTDVLIWCTFFKLLLTLTLTLTPV